MLKIGKFLVANTAYIRAYCSNTGFAKMSAEINPGVSVSRVISALENFAPNALAEGWDNTGLLVEPYTHRLGYN